MDIGRFWAKARPLDSDRGPQWHPLAYHSLDVAAVGDALLRSHPRLNESFARLLGLPPEDTASLIRYLLCLHDIGKFAKKFQAKMPCLLPDCFGDELAKLATRFDHGAGGLRLFDADPDRFLLPHGARPRAWPPLIAATVADAHEVRRLEAGCVVVGLDKGLHHPRAVVVAGLEVRPHPTQHPAQHMAGQMPTPYRGANEESAQAHHSVQMRGALLVAPRHPRIARADAAPRRRTRAHPASHGPTR